MPGTKIINRQLDAHLTQLLQSPDTRINMMHGSRFGNLDHQMLRINFILIQKLFQCADQMLMLKLNRR